jgi:hypothetical protein
LTHLYKKMTLPVAAPTSFQAGRESLPGTNRLSEADDVMILRLSAGEVEEVRRALVSAHSQVIRSLDQFDGNGGYGAGLGLCRRKWALEALLRQLDQPPEPARLLTIVLPVQGHKTPVDAAA